MEEPKLTLNEHFFAPLEDVFSDPLVVAAWRSCKVITDELFVKSSIFRVLENVQSGRDWVQQMRHTSGLEISAANYFAELESSRRLALTQAVSQALKNRYLDLLRSRSDRLAGIPQLAGWEVWAADGHAIEHACHDSKKVRSDGSSEYVSVTHIYAMDLRSGWMHPLVLCKGDEHEIRALKERAIEQLKLKAQAGVIWVYDRAIIDYRWWLKCKAQSKICFISRTKAGLDPMHELPLAFNRSDPINQGVLSDEIVGINNVGQLRRVRYKDPETGEIFEFLTSEFSLAPGLIALLYRLRWDTEKAFDEFKNKLCEQKAWATTDNAKTIQSHFITLAYNLILLQQADFDVNHGLRESKVERKHEGWVERRAQTARSLGRMLNGFVLSVRKATEHSLQYLRCLRYHLRRSSSLEESLEDFFVYMSVYI